MFDCKRIEIVRPESLQYWTKDWLTFVLETRFLQLIILPKNIQHLPWIVHLSYFLPKILDYKFLCYMFPLIPKYYLKGVYESLKLWRCSFKFLNVSSKHEVKYQLIIRCVQSDPFLYSSAYICSIMFIFYSKVP